MRSRGGTDGERPTLAGLRGGELSGRDGALDSEHPPIEVVEAEGRELATASARIGGETDQEKVLLGVVFEEGE
jgi:hypothetical protein